MSAKSILLIISGGIAAYKSLELIRLFRREGYEVSPVMTRAAEQFVTPLSVAALSGADVHRDLFDLTSEAEMGHIQLSRSADLIVVAPATANLMANMAQGAATDMATTLLLATDTPVLIAPAMNVRMWTHAATQRNIQTLRDDGIHFIGPNDGDMACGEFGPGRMSEPAAILAAAQAMLRDGPLNGRRILVTSGPTHEPIDPVRYIANRSSGAQGTAIAEALLALGANVVFVTGPADAPRPMGAEVVEVQTARQMADAVEIALPCDAAIFCAAVADWHVVGAGNSKIKKDGKGTLPSFELAENPDILATVSKGANRPELVVGFAAETDDVIAHATAKRARKGCDWIVANDVSPATGIMGGSENAAILITADGADPWPRMSKADTARKLAAHIAEALT